MVVLIAFWTGLGASPYFWPASLGWMFSHRNLVVGHVLDWFQFAKRRSKLMVFCLVSKFWAMATYTSENWQAKLPTELMTTSICVFAPGLHHPLLWRGSHQCSRRGSEGGVESIPTEARRCWGQVGKIDDQQVGKVDVLRDFSHIFKIF